MPKAVRIIPPTRERDELPFVDDHSYWAPGRIRPERGKSRYAEKNCLGACYAATYVERLRRGRVPLILVDIIEAATGRRLDPTAASFIDAIDHILRTGSAPLSRDLHIIDGGRP